MISNLIMSLTKHASLAQDVLDSDVNFGAVEYLSQCKWHLEALSELENNGKLPEAVNACDELDSFLKTIPVPLDTSKVMIDFKVRFLLNSLRSLLYSTARSDVTGFSKTVYKNN